MFPGMQILCYCCGVLPARSSCVAVKLDYVLTRVEDLPAAASAYVRQRLPRVTLIIIIKSPQISLVFSYVC
jgi:hypothetical protein